MTDLARRAVLYPPHGWEHVRKLLTNIRETPGCILWLGKPTSSGYGVVNFKVGRNQRTISAHRFAWEVAAGQAVPEDLTIDHTCRVTLCVNPDHLQVKPLAENTKWSRTARQLVVPPQFVHVVPPGCGLEHVSGHPRLFDDDEAS